MDSGAWSPVLSPSPALDSQRPQEERPWPALQRCRGAAARPVGGGRCRVPVHGLAAGRRARCRQGRLPAAGPPHRARHLLRPPFFRFGETIACIVNTAVQAIQLLMKFSKLIVDDQLTICNLRICLCFQGLSARMEIHCFCR